MDRFDLESCIMSCWNTKDDIELLSESFSNMTNDELINALIGIAQLHQMRCQKLMDTFEDLVCNSMI